MSSPNPGGPRISAVSDTSAAERSTWSRQDNPLHVSPKKQVETHDPQRLDLNTEPPPQASTQPESVQNQLGRQQSDQLQSEQEQLGQEQSEQQQSEQQQSERQQPEQQQLEPHQVAEEALNTIGEDHDQAEKFASEPLPETSRLDENGIQEEHLVDTGSSAQPIDSDMHQEEHGSPDKQDHQQDQGIFKPSVFSVDFQDQRVAQQLDGHQHNQTQGMDLHDTGSLLHQFASENDVAPSVVPNVPQSHSASPLAPHTMNHAVSQGLAPNVVQMGHQVSTNGPQGLQQSVGGGHPASDPISVHQPLGEGSAKPQGVAKNESSLPVDSVKKPTRMPGTKQCPSCRGTIAAAVAKCPRCEHVFRAKKEKQKRSGKRGKKNCPKCGHENPSACSSCKDCKHVFRLKLMDRYKQIRNRSGAAHASAGIPTVHTASTLGGQPPPPPMNQQVVAPSSVPMQPGVTTYHAPIAQPLHPVHSAIPPLVQHTMGMHHVATHNVHPPTVQQMHPMPQHPMHQHPTHPQL